MSNAANRHAVAVAVNRVLREEKVISVEQTHRSYRRLVSLQVEFEHIDTASALLKLVRLRIASRAGAKTAPVEVAPVVEAPVVVAPAKKKRASRKSKLVEAIEAAGLVI